MEFEFLCVLSNAHIDTLTPRRGFLRNNIQFYMQRTDLKTPQPFNQSSSAANSVEAGGE